MDTNNPNSNTVPMPEQQPKSSRKPLIPLVLFLLIFFMVLGFSAYYIFYPIYKGFLPAPTQQPAQNGNLAIDKNGQFADYTDTPVNIEPEKLDYTVNPELSNVENMDQFSIAQEGQKLLLKNNFVVTPSWSDEFFEVYENNRYGYTPSFVTTDSILHNYHLMFNFILQKLEEQKLFDLQKNLNQKMLSTAVSHYNALKGTQWENAAKREVGFFAVGSKLLTPDVQVPDMVKNEVDSELKLITAHNGIAESPVMNIGQAKGATSPSPYGDLSLDQLKEDYTQYIPRGHYTKSEQLENYFRSMMWYGRLTFRFKSDDEIRSAMLITLALQNQNNYGPWNDAFQTIEFFVGKTDDITFNHLNGLIKDVYGSATPASLAQDTSKFDAFKEKLNKLDPPQINSMPIFDPSIQPDRTKEIKGFRYMGQRFTIDAAIFQKLVYRDVLPAADNEQRMLPKGLDIPAAFGSQTAVDLLKGSKEDRFPNYMDNMNKVQTYVNNIDKNIWTQNLYWSWMYTLRTLTDDIPQQYPNFMQNTAWKHKEINTFLGSWTELKHDTILYAKQVYAEMGGGGPEERDDRGYVEPNPELYGRMASLIKLTKDGLNSRDLITTQTAGNLDKMYNLTISLKNISEKELSNKKLTDEDYEVIRSYGGQLESLWLEINKEEMEKIGIDSRNYLNQNPAALVADVATDPNGQVLEEATGRIFNIYVIVPVDGKLRLAKGAVYSYYEFPWPMNDRLTDEKWRAMLDDQKAPELPSWTQSFITGK